MGGLGQKWCRCFALILAAGMCYGQDTCEVIPKNLSVKPGSNVTVVFRAPFDSICRKNLKAFSLRKLFWTLNGIKIEERHYTHNSTHAMVTIVNFNQSGTVECHMHEQVLGGTIVHGQAASRNNRMVVDHPKKPVNISCVTNATNFSRQYTICYWDEVGNSLNSYRVLMEQESNSGHCISQPGQNYCRLSRAASPYQINMTVTVTAQNSVGNASATVFFNTWEISKYDPPSGVRVRPLPTGLRVEWDKNSHHYPEEVEKCEAQCVEEATNLKIVSQKTTPSENAIFVGDVKPCTRYTVAVRCAYMAHDTASLWSDWSTGITVMSTLRISTVPFHLWGKVFEQYANGTRRVQLMWKGPPPICNAVDEYRLSVGSEDFKSLKPNQHYATVLLDAAHHQITIAAYKNNTKLRHSTLKIPSSGKDMPSVQRPMATARVGLIRVTWDAPSTPVKYYVIEWFTDPAQAARPLWNRTQDTNISLPGAVPFKLYTVTITPLYEGGPGQRSIVYTYAKQGAPAQVKHVRKVEADATWLTVRWDSVQPDQCCGFVVNYTVFCTALNNSSKLNVTVNHTSQLWGQVTLKDLTPSTMYQVHVRANSIDNSSVNGEPHTFKTEAYGRAFIWALVYAGISLILLLVFAVGTFLLRRKVLSVLVPDPQLSSMAMWAPDKSLEPLFTDNLDLDNSHKERILLCHVDSEKDTKMASAVDPTPSRPMKDGTDGASVAQDTSSSSGQLETSGGTVIYSFWDFQSKNPSEAVEPMPSQPDQASPSPRKPYLDQMSVCGGGETQAGRPQGRGMPDKAQIVVEVNRSEQETSNLAPSATTYVTVDSLDDQKETSKLFALEGKWF